MRQVIFLDKAGNVCGEFPHDPEIGFVSGKRGLRRRLVLKDEADTLSDVQLQAVAMQRYTAEEKRIRDTQFANDVAQRRAAQIRRDISVKDAARQWFDHLAVTNRPNTVQSYKRTMSIYLEGVGDHRLRDMSRAKNVEFLAALQRTETRPGSGKFLSVTTQHSHLTQFNVFLSWAHENELLEQLIKFKKPRIQQKDMDVCTVDQLRRFRCWLFDNLQQAETSRDRMHARNLIRAYFAGTNLLLRTASIAALPLSAIDLKNRVVKIRSVPERDFNPKGMKWPNKPVNDRLYEFLLDDLANRNPREKWFLDKGDGRPWFEHTNNVSRAMAKAFRAAGMPPDVKPFHHGMRASMITWLLENGETPVRVQQLADHSDLATTMKYYNTRASQQRSAVDRLPDI